MSCIVRAICSESNSNVQNAIELQFGGMIVEYIRIREEDRFVERVDDQMRIQKDKSTNNL